MSFDRKRDKTIDGVLTVHDRVAERVSETFSDVEFEAIGIRQAVYQAVMHLSPQSRRHDHQGHRDGSRHSGVDGDDVPWLHCGSAWWNGRYAEQGKPGRTREHECDADRKRAHRDQFRSELRMALDLVVGGDRAARHCSQAIAELRQQMSEFGFGKDTALSTVDRADLDAIGVLVDASIFHAEPLDFFPLDDIEAFIDGLHWWHQFWDESKETNGLISPAIFDPSLSEETSRGLGEHPRDLGRKFLDQSSSVA